MKNTFIRPIESYAFLYPYLDFAATDFLEHCDLAMLHHGEIVFSESDGYNTIREYSTVFLYCSRSQAATKVTCNHATNKHLPCTTVGLL